jgi:putative flippase GtrA
MLLRWLKFNVVGAGGVGVQLASLALLVEGAGLAVLPATLVATELAVLHNFAWHAAWTWADRPAPAGGTGVRLVRFHLANGVVSVAGNLAVMALLAGGLGVPYLAANVAAITACAVVNFLLGERVVFAGGALASGWAGRPRSSSRADPDSRGRA